MTFSLELMTQEDHNRVYSEENVALLTKYCSFQHRWDVSAERNWAVDRERNLAFLRLTTAPPSDGMYRYVLLFENVPLYVQMGRRENILPIDLPTPLQRRLGDVQDVLREAFFVYGYYGLPHANILNSPRPKFESGDYQNNREDLY
jgi:hypothetical protein